MLKLYKRGEYYHIRGTVSRYDKSITIRQSTGKRKRKEAHEILQSLEAQALYRIEGVNNTTPFSLVADRWLNLKNRNTFDEFCVPKLKMAFGNKLINTFTQEDWFDYRNTFLQDKANSYSNRIRATLVAILNYGQVPIKIPREKDAEDRIRFLTIEQQEKLLASYPDFIRPLFITLCYEGLRVGEAITLKSKHINLENNSILIDKSKSGKRRIVPLHPRVRSVINTNHYDLFTNMHGVPYKEGKNLRRVHLTACKRAGIEDFRIHDWRHHWASRLTMKGATMPALMKLGGWSSERMVLRYASVSEQHIIDTINLL
jgi:integrase